MAHGVRVSCIKHGITKEFLRTYFKDARHPGDVDKIYYPLMNNDAVIFFSDPQASLQVLSEQHGNFTVCCLPPEVFTKVQVWLNRDLSALLLANPGYLDELIDVGDLKIVKDKETQEIILEGKVYQVEWAHKHLSDICVSRYDLQLASEKTHISGAAGVDVIDGMRTVQLTGKANTDRVAGIPTAELHSTDEHGEKKPVTDEHQHVSGECPVAKATVSEVSRLNTPEADTQQLLAVGISGRIFSQNTNQNMSLTRDRIENHHFIGPQDGVSSIFADVYRDEGKLALDAANTSRCFESCTQQGISSYKAHSIRPDHVMFSRMTRGDAEQVSPGRSGQSFPRTSSLQVHGGEGESTSHPQQPLLVAESSSSVVSAETCADVDRQVGFDRWKEESGDEFADEGAMALVTTAATAASSISSDLLHREFSIGRKLTLKIYCEDIVKVQTDVVVSPANCQLSNIGGVARVIARAAGPEMTEECNGILNERGFLRTTQVVWTKACGRLRHLKYVFHAVGPIVSTEEERDVFELSETFFNSLELAEHLHLRSIAFPFISAGIYGMEIDQCVLALITAVLAYANMCPSSKLEEVHFVHNDINVVGEAIILADQQMTQEDAHSALQRLEQGRLIYGQNDVCSHCLNYSSYSSRKGDRGKQEAGCFCLWNGSYSTVPKYGTVSSYSTVPRSSTVPSYSSHPWLAPSSMMDNGAESKIKPSGTRDSLHTPQPLSATSYGQRRQRSSSLDRGKGSDSSLIAARRAPSPVTQTSSRLHGGVAQPHTLAITRDEAAATAVKKNGVTDVRPKDAKAKKFPTVRKSLSTRTVTRTGKRSNPKTQENVNSISLPTRKQPGEIKKKESKTSAPSTTSDTDTGSAPDGEDTDDLCPVCLQQLHRPKKLACGHIFCKDCIDTAMKFKPRCPKCQHNYGIQTGNQPPSGRMTHKLNLLQHIPGFPCSGSIIIEYDFPAGVQEEGHPNPGRRYSGTHRTAYLPNTAEGHNVLQMLKKAFDQRLVFTIGVSCTTGASDVITWNDIHHKTSIDGGPANFGYPDDGYLIRVREELAAKGITSP